MHSPYSHLNARFHEAYAAEMRAQAGRARRNRRRPVSGLPLRDRVGHRLIALGERLVHHPPLDEAA